MLRNYTLVTDDVDLAKPSDREGARRGGKRRKKGKKGRRMVVVMMMRKRTNRKKILLASAVGQGVRCRGLFVSVTG